MVGIRATREQLVRFQKITVLGRCGIIQVYEWVATHLLSQDREILADGLNVKWNSLDSGNVSRGHRPHPHLS